MLCLTTLSGKYVFREKDLSSTPAATLLWKNLTTLSGREPIIGPVLEELVACLRGESYCWKACCRYVPARGREYEILETNSGSRLRIICSDASLEYSTAMLRRRFQFVDDYLTEHPDEKSIRVPYTAAEVRTVIAKYGHSLSQCYNCLAHFNPKSNIYPFYFDLEGIPLTIIENLSRNVTEKEKECLVRYVLERNIKLPSLSMPHLLVVFPCVARDKALMEALFLEKHPSYLFCHTMERRSDWYSTAQEAASRLLTWDFSVDMDELYYSETETLRRVKDLIDSCLEDVEASGLEALCELLGIAVPVVLPYGVTIPREKTPTESLRKKIEEAKKARDWLSRACASTSQ